MADAEIHRPAMVGEVLFYLDCGPGKIFVDATVGGGGHACAILKASSPDGFLIGVDRDQEVLSEAEKALEKYRGRFALHHANFGELGELLAKLGYTGVDGLLLDLGISSWQVDLPERGFSFRSEATLDMRMDRSKGMTAEKLIRTSSEKELTEIIRTFGEEPRARTIARAILRAADGSSPLTTTVLAGTVQKAIGAGRPRGRRMINPATRTFQALRIAVNREMEALDEVLEQVPQIVKSGGRCCAIAYHSLEDRKVKNVFRELGRKIRGGDPPRAEVLTKKPVRPSAEEVRENPRSRSARLRALSMREER